MSIQITHVRLSGGVRDHEHISHVQWVNPADGKVEHNTTAVVVDWIDNKNGQAFVGTGGSQVLVGTVHPAGGTPYLRTHADGKWTNNLLALDEF